VKVDANRLAVKVDAKRLAVGGLSKYKFTCRKNSYGLEPSAWLPMMWISKI
jgi:hypothetical protein